jgi:hypothetical protein
MSWSAWAVSPVLPGRLTRAAGIGLQTSDRPCWVRESPLTWANRREGWIATAQSALALQDPQRTRNRLAPEASKLPLEGAARVLVMTAAGVAQYLQLPLQARSLLCRTPNPLAVVVTGLMRSLSPSYRGVPARTTC